jgi:hypothetical protein
MKDRPRLLRARPTTVAYLTSLPRPAYLPPRRLRFEHRIFTVVARVTLDRLEDDLDYHLVLRSGFRTDDRRDTLAALREGSHRLPAPADGQFPESCPHLPAGACYRRGLLRLPARTDRRRTERDRATPCPRLRLPLRLSAVWTSRPRA